MIRFDSAESAERVTVRRIDAPQTMSKPERTPEGYLRCEGILTTTGVFRYTNPDGTERHELRLPEEVFHPDSMKSFHLVPITDDHPDCGWLDSTNAKDHARGAVDMPAKHGDSAMRAKLLITDEGLATKILNRDKVQISNGYFADLEMRSGEYNGERFDAVQRQIRGNHVAIVDEARAGPEARIKLDASDAVASLPVPVVPSQRSPQRREDSTVKIRIDGVDFDVPEQTAQAFQRRLDELKKERNDERSKVEELTAKLGKAEGERDAARKIATKLDADLKAIQDPRRIREAVAARVALETSARKVLGGEAKLDALADKEIRAQVATKVLDVKLDGKSDDYVQAMFDAAVAQAEKGGGIESVREFIHADDAVTDRTQVRVDDAETQFLKDSRDAWKRPLAAGKRNGSVQVK